MFKLDLDMIFIGGRSRISQTGGTNLQGGANLLFGQFFPENSIKIKEYGCRGGHTSLAPPLDPPMCMLKMKFPATAAQKL